MVCHSGIQVYWVEVSRGQKERGFPKRKGHGGKFCRNFFCLGLSPEMHMSGAGSASPVPHLGLPEESPEPAKTKPPKFKGTG